MDCPIGFAQPNSNQGDCLPCAANLVALTPGSSNCETCAVGKQKSISNICEDCSPGFFSEISGNNCTACSTGQYQDENGKQSCKDCASGKYSSISGKISCNNCPLGWKQDTAGQTLCEKCPSKTFEQNNTCEQCAVGFYNNKEGQFACTVCRSGQISDAGKEECTKCIQGQYQKDNECETCPNDSVPNFNGPGSSRCITCETNDNCQVCPALYKAVGGNCVPCLNNTVSTGTECEFCKPGVQFNSDEQICTVCPTGYYRFDQNDQPCKKCSVGNFQNFEGRDICKLCNYGQYQTEIGQSNCKLCGVNEITLDTGSISSDNCTTCELGKYVIDQACSICIAGTFINGGICDSCPSGFESTTQNAGLCSICPVGKAALSKKTCNMCTGYAYQNEEGQPTCKTCAVASGSTIGCSSCIAGKYFDSDIKSCKECAKGKWSGMRQTECTDCSEGRFQQVTGQEYCDKCSKGRYINVKGQDKCKQCESGTFQPYKGQKICMNCLPGQYQPNQGKLKCKTCPVGKYSEEIGMTSALSCKNCPVGYFSSQGLCEKCTEGSYQDYEAQDSCKNCPTSKNLSPEGSTTPEDCFSGNGLVSYVFNMKEDSKQTQTITRQCEIRPNLVLLCPGCRCANSARDGFWDSPVCDECQRGYAQSKCKVICPGYDGKNDDTICSGLGSCWFGKNGNGLCYCGGHSKIDSTSENAVVDVRLCSKGEKCNGYGPDYQTESKYNPIYYLMKYRQFSVYVLKLRTYTPKRGHMWFTRYPRSIAYQNDCRQCVGAYDSSDRMRSRTYVGAYDMETVPPIYVSFSEHLQSKNGFHGENCQYECGLCLHGGKCANVPHPYRFKYTIYDTFERQQEIYVPQTNCICSSTVYDASAMCCPKGFQPYIYYGVRGSEPYSRYSRTPYLTTIQHTEKSFWVDKDLWIARDHGTPNYFIPTSKKMYVADTDKVSEKNYLEHGPFGKHIFYGFEKELCRPCPGLFGKGIRFQAHKVETTSLAEFYWWDASFGAEQRKCNGIGVCDFYTKDTEPQVKFMGDAQEYILLKKGYICSEKPDNNAIDVQTLQECIENKNTEFVTIVEPYLAVVDDTDLYSLDGVYPFVTVDEIIAKRLSSEGLFTPLIKIQGPAILKFSKQFKQVARGRCKDINLRISTSIDRGSGLSNNQAAISCAKECVSQNPTNNILEKKEIKGFSVKLGFSQGDELFCYCETTKSSNCEIDPADISNYIFYEWDDSLEHPESEFIAYSVLKRDMRLPKPNTNTKYLIIPTTTEKCRGWSECDLTDLSEKYEISIYSKNKGFGDDRLTESTFDRFDTCFTYTKNEPTTLGSYTTINYVNGEDPFVGGLCPKGYFCTETSAEIGFKEACPAGYYQPKQGQTRTNPDGTNPDIRCSILTSFHSHCHENVATKNSNDYVDLVCKRCPRNTYAPEGSYQCTECPQGKVKKLSGVPYTPFKVWNTPNKNQVSPWYYVPDEAGTEIEDCALMPAGVIHIPQLNHMLTYDEHRFLPIVTCPYGFSSPRGTFMYTGDENADSIYLELSANTQEPPYAELKYQANNEAWKLIVTTYCHECPGNSITGEDSTRCTTCFANQMKKYMKDVIQKSVKKTELQPLHKCCPQTVSATISETKCTETGVRTTNNVEECRNSATQIVIEYKMRAFGSCEDETGWASIATRDGCQQAAQDLDDISPPVLDFIAKGAESHHPKGCSVKQTYYTYNGKTGPYNYLRWKGVSGEQTACNNVYVCICKRITEKGEETTGTNAIAAPGNLINRGDEPPDPPKLLACEGNCNTNAICQNGLTCWQRETSSSIVPGCKKGGGGDVNKHDYCYNSLQVVKIVTASYNDYFATNTDANRPKGCYIDESNQVYFNNKQGTDDCTGIGDLYGKGCICISTNNIRCSEDTDINRRNARNNEACQTAQGEWIVPTQTELDGGQFEIRPDRQLTLAPENLVNIVVEQALESGKYVSLGKGQCIGGYSPLNPLIYTGSTTEPANDRTLIKRCAIGCIDRKIDPILNNIQWSSVGRVYGFIVNLNALPTTDNRGRCYCQTSPLDCSALGGSRVIVSTWEMFKFDSQPTSMYCQDNKCLFQEMIVADSVEMVPADCIILCLQVYGGDSVTQGTVDDPKTAIGFHTGNKNCLCGSGTSITATDNFVDDTPHMEEIAYPWNGVRMDIVQVLQDGDDTLYKRVLSGKCTDEPGWDYIDTAENCKIAATSLGFSNTGLVTPDVWEWQETFPTKCWYHTVSAGGAVKFNTFDSNTDCWAVGNCICQYSSPKTPNWDGLPLCAACQGGTHRMLNGGCDPCEPGYYTADAKDAQMYTCKSCPSGYYQAEKKKTNCLECAVGKNQQYEAETQCEDCPIGYYQDISASSICKECELGKYQDKTAQSICIDCVPGKMSRTGVDGENTEQLRKICDDCAVGRYQPKHTTQECPICVAGKHSNINGLQSTHCVVCEVGRVQSLQERGVCLDCEAGKATMNGVINCVECPTGWSQPVKSQRLCLECRGGGYCTDVKATSCVAGTYKDHNKDINVATQEMDSTDCINCPSGKYSESGNIDCRQYTNNVKSIIDRANNCRGWTCYFISSFKANAQQDYNNAPYVCKSETTWTAASTGCRCYFEPSRTDCECCNAGGCQNSAGKCVICSSCPAEEPYNKICEWNKQLADGIYSCANCPSGYTTLGEPGATKCEFCGDEGWTGDGWGFKGSCGTSEWPSYHGEAGTKFTKTYNTFIKNEVDGKITCYIRNSCTTNWGVDFKFGGEKASKWYQCHFGYFNVFGLLFGWAYSGVWSDIKSAIASGLCNRDKNHGKYDSYCSLDWGPFTSPVLKSLPAYKFEMEKGAITPMEIRHLRGWSWDVHLDLWVECYGEAAAPAGTPISLWKAEPQQGCFPQKTYSNTFYNP